QPFSALVRRCKRTSRRPTGGERRLDRVVESLPYAAGLERGELGGGELELVARHRGLREAAHVFLELRRFVGIRARADIAGGDAPFRSPLGRRHPFDEL